MTKDEIAAARARLDTSSQTPADFRKALDALEALTEAVRAVYYAGVWSCDRPVDEAALWTTLRDAAGFTPGQSPKPIEGVE